jgi:putative transposase
MRVIFARVCEKAGAQLVEVDGEGDHVHLLVHYPPTVYLPELVNSLKGVSSRLLESQIPGAKRDCKGGALWSPSYFIASCGGAPLEIIKQYIEQQRS